MPPVLVVPSGHLAKKLQFSRIHIFWISCWLPLYLVATWLLSGAYLVTVYHWNEWNEWIKLTSSVSEKYIRKNKTAKSESTYQSDLFSNMQSPQSELTLKSKYLWLSVTIRGILSLSVAIYGYPWLSRAIYGRLAITCDHIIFLSVNLLIPWFTDVWPFLRQFFLA